VLDLVCARDGGDDGYCGSTADETAQVEESTLVVCKVVHTFCLALSAGDMCDGDIRTEQGRLMLRIRADLRARRGNRSNPIKRICVQGVCIDSSGLPCMMQVSRPRSYMHAR
jgi:hypothetical protein